MFACVSVLKIIKLMETYKPQTSNIKLFRFGMSIIQNDYVITSLPIILMQSLGSNQLGKQHMISWVI